jgi:hypothetical protein
MVKWLRRLFPYPITRGTYWSCTRFADWVRKTFGGFQKPSSATLEEWSGWKKASKTAHGFVYWLTEEFFDSVQDVIMFPADVWSVIRSYLRNRFVDKMHYLPTRLKAGQYYELDTRILHGLFESLVDFIECEKAWMAVVFDEAAMKKYGYPKWPRWLRFGSFRCTQAGIDHLNWEMSLRFGDDWGIAPDNEKYGQTPPQAIAAKEQLELYTWWKNVRPARVDPYDTSKDLERPERWDQINAMEEQYEKEDEEMLIRLIKIRRSLWT